MRFPNLSTVYTDFSKAFARILHVFLKAVAKAALSKSRAHRFVSNSLDGLSSRLIIDKTAHIDFKFNKGIPHTIPYPLSSLLFILYTIPLDSWIRHNIPFSPPSNKIYASSHLWCIDDLNSTLRITSVVSLDLKEKSQSMELVVNPKKCTIWNLSIYGPTDGLDSVSIPIIDNSTHPYKYIGVYEQHSSSIPSTLERVLVSFIDRLNRIVSTRLSLGNFSSGYKHVVYERVSLLCSSLCFLASWNSEPGKKMGVTLINNGCWTLFQYKWKIFFPSEKGGLGIMNPYTIFLRELNRCLSFINLRQTVFYIKPLNAYPLLRLVL